MRELVALPASGGARFVAALLQAWDAGDAVLPVDPRLPPAAVAELLVTMQPTVLIDADGEHHRQVDGRPAEDGDALVVATSGSTGAPKGVLLTHEAVAASAVAVNEALEVVGASDGWLCCLPTAHVAGLGAITRSLAAGTRLEVQDRFDANEVRAAALDRGATLTSVVPTALDRIDPSWFRAVIVGGAAPPTGRPPNVFASYGMTETGSAVCLDGRPLRDVGLRIVDGEIHVRGPMLLRAYRDGTVPLDADGWFATGDLGELDDDGVLTVHGRAGDLIITGGENVWPAAVEAVLYQLPGVAEVGVVGRPDPEWGAVVTAVVVPTDPAAPPTLEDLRAAAADRLPRFALPRRLELVEALPRTALGKLRRHET